MNLDPIIPKVAQLTDSQLIDALWAQGVKLADVRSDLARAHNWHIHDIRLAVFTKIENVVRCAALGFESITNFLSLPRYDRVGIERNPIGPIETSELAMFYKLGFVHFMFSATESSFRQLLRAINLEKCNGGSADFRSVYECLIREELGLPGAKDYIDMLDLFRLIRNTVHNNGVYFQKSGDSREVTYQGMVYQFKHGQKIDTVMWHLCLSILNDVIGLFITITSHARVLSLPPIKDTSAP